MLDWIRNHVLSPMESPYRDDPAHATKMRVAWKNAAAELSLNHVIGDTTFEDRIDGYIDIFKVAVSYEPNFDVQKPETIISACLEGRSEKLPMSDSNRLLEIYDENAADHGKLIEEERAWLSGHRGGLGIRGNMNELHYCQLYWMYDASDIVFVCTAMLKIMPLLDPSRTKVQRSK
jgi:hypothetical protein